MANTLAKQVCKRTLYYYIMICTWLIYCVWFTKRRFRNLRNCIKYVLPAAYIQIIYPIIKHVIKNLFEEN